MNLNTTRRSFLKWFAAAPASAWAATQPEPAPPEQVVLLDEFHVAGVRYYKGREMLENMKTGQTLALRAEPTNRHDEFAVEVFCGGTKLGYVPRTHNQHISRLLAQGVTLRCEVARVNLDVDYWESVEARVGLTVPGTARKLA